MRVGADIRRLTPLHVRLGRTAVGLSVRELAELAEVAPSTINRFEVGRGEIFASTLERIMKVLEDRGVVFILADATGGPGVRLKG